MTKFGQAEYSDFMARVFADKLMKFLKQPTNRILTAKIRKIYTVSSRLQGTQHKGVKKC